jgi:hypothetical protein
VENEASLRVPRVRDGLHHRCLAVRKRVFGNKGQTAMTLAELEVHLRLAEAQLPLRITSTS